MVDEARSGKDRPEAGASFRNNPFSRGNSSNEGAWQFTGEFDTAKVTTLRHAMLAKIDGTVVEFMAPFALAAKIQGQTDLAKSAERASQRRGNTILQNPASLVSTAELASQTVPSIDAETSSRRDLAVLLPNMLQDLSKNPDKTRVVGDFTMDEAGGRDQFIFICQILASDPAQLDAARPVGQADASNESVVPSTVEGYGLVLHRHSVQNTVYQKLYLQKMPML